jgi:receptor-type tyrosine-protein phosphatase zeta
MSNTSVLQMAELGDFSDTTTNEPYVNAGKPFTMYCQNPPTSVPAPRYSWDIADDKDAQLATTTPVILSSRQQIDEKGNLHFASVLQSDDMAEKFYKCNVRNARMDVLKGGSYTKLHVNPGNIVNQAPQPLFSSGALVKGLEHQAVSLRCFFSGTPTPKISWTRVGAALPTGRWTLSLFDSEAVIDQLDPSDAGQYQCTGSNSVGANSVVGITLAVEAAPVFRTMEDRPHNINATEGDTVTINCSAHAIPTAEIIWYRNAARLSATLPAKYRLSADRRNLTIVNLCKINCADDQNDLTVIQCLANNTYNSTFAQGYVNVLVATKIVEKSEEILYEPNRELIFPCQAVTDESTVVTYSWYFNGDQLIEYNEQVYFDESNYELHVNTSGDADAGHGRVGSYTCTASNGFSVARLTHYYLLEPAARKSAADLWWIFLLIALLLLLLLLVLLCCLMLRHNKGDSYPVDEKERFTGNDPEKELFENGFHDYQRPTGLVGTLQGSRGGQPGAHGSLSGSQGALYASEDDSSLNAYAQSDMGRFQEDGSFIGQYNPNQKPGGKQRKPK